MALRFDRFVTTALVHPVLQAVRRLRVPGPECIFPILMYHSITDDPEPGVCGYYRLNTPPSLFRDHLRILRDEGFSVVDLNTALELDKDVGASSAAKLEISSGSGVPGAGISVPHRFLSTFDADRPNCVSVESRAVPEQTRRTVSESQAFTSHQQKKLAVITFDDGFHDFLTGASPALASFGFSATVFLPTAFIGRDRRAFKNRQCLTWGEVRELRQQGVGFGSHTVNHPKLWDLDHAAFVSELRQSRQTLEDELGEPIDSFAHPYAFPSDNAAYIDRFRKTLTNSGYRFGVTTSLGCARRGDDPLLLKRLPANSADDASLFRAKLDGAYDWLAKPQALVKKVKRLAFNQGETDGNP